MNKDYLVSSITINGNETFVAYLPAVFSEYGLLAKPWLRTYAFNACDVNFLFTEIESITTYSTESQNEQPYIMDLIDYDYDDTVKVQVTPLVKNSCIVSIDTDQFQTDTVEQLIFEQLTQYLELDFMIE